EKPDDFTVIEIRVGKPVENGSDRPIDRFARFPDLVPDDRGSSRDIKPMVGIQNVPGDWRSRGAGLQRRAEWRRARSPQGYRDEAIGNALALPAGRNRVRWIKAHHVRVALDQILRDRTPPLRADEIHLYDFILFG